MGAARCRRGADDAAEVRGEGRQERGLALGEGSPQPAQVPLEGALGEEQGEGSLLDRAGTPRGGLELGHVRAHRGGRDDRVAGPQAGEENLAERADVEDPPVGVEALERRQGRPS